MRRLLKIREFFDLKKRNLEEDSSGSDGNRPVKRSRKSLTSEDDGSALATPSSQSDKALQKAYERFLQVFEKERAKDCVWWLPGRKGEAFAMHKERFEHTILKIHLEEHSFNDFVEKLKRWGFKQMNIPSLSGRILAFENNSSQSPTCPRVASPPQERTAASGVSSLQSHQSRNGLQRQTVAATTQAFLTQTRAGPSQDEISPVNFANMSSVQLQQAQYMVQQEIAQTYFNLLWQELQRQLSVLLTQQSQGNHSFQLGAAPRSEILDLATLLQQQQVQQQNMAAQFMQAAIARPSTLLEQQTVVREINELQQQELSNLTYQIVALVAANLEQQNQNPEPTPEVPAIQRILVKYMIALVLLQLQQQQHSLEFLRQERLTSLALVRSVNVESSGGVALPDPLNALQMQQLLSEAAMLSLSRAHQLLCEAAILIPTTAVVQPSSPSPPSATNRNHGTPPTPPSFPGSGFGGPHPPRTTTAR